MDKSRQEQIARRAYALWEEAGQPEGGADGFWYQAEREIEPAGIGDEASAARYVKDLETPAKPKPKKPRAKAAPKTEDKPARKPREKAATATTAKAPRKARAARKPTQ